MNLENGFKKNEHLNMRQVVQKKFLSNMIQQATRSSITETGSSWTIMVVDERTSRILSSVLRMSDLMEEGISLVEQLKMKRQPFPQMEVIYFITPTSQSIQYMYP